MRRHFVGCKLAMALSSYGSRLIHISNNLNLDIPSSGYPHLKYTATHVYILGNQNC